MDMFHILVLLETIRTMQFTPSLILDTFFTGGTFTHTADELTWDIQVGGLSLAPYVYSCDDALVVDRGTAASNSVKLPYINLERDLSACCKMLLRSPGESIYSTRTPQQRAAEMLANDLADLTQMIRLTCEWQAIQAITTGKAPIKGPSINQMVDFKMPAAHLGTLPAADLWTASTSKPLKFLDKTAAMISKSSGLTAGTVVGGTDAIDAFLENASVQQKLNQQSGFSAGKVNLLAPDVEGVKNFGNVAGFDILRYNQEFYNPITDAMEPAIPTDRIVIGSRRSKAERHYGPIQSFAEGNPEVDIFPHTWNSPNGKTKHLNVESSPLMIPRQPDAFASYKVI
jgi:Phage major capsid protein E